jgi:hypothetical protein
MNYTLSRIWPYRACCDPSRGIISPVPRSRSAQSKGAGAARVACLRGSNMLPTCTGLLQDGESMPTLTDEIKTFIVKSLACFDTPSQVAEAVKVNFDVEISRQHVYAYDPIASQQISPRRDRCHA